MWDRESKDSPEPDRHQTCQQQLLIWGDHGMLILKVLQKKSFELEFYIQLYYYSFIFKKPNSQTHFTEAFFFGHAAQFVGY